MNRRESARHECCVPLLDERQQALKHSHTIDISRTGAGFISAKFIPVNSKLMVELALSPEGLPVLVQGRVKWIEKIPNTSNFRVGMNFSDIPEVSQSRIEELLNSKIS